MHFRIIAAFFIVFLLAISSLNAQNQFNGRVVQKKTGNYLDNALVMLLNKKDSLILEYVRTKKDGTFAISVKDSGEYLLTISYPRYEVRYQKIFVKGNQVTLPPIELDQLENIIDEVVISRNKFSIKLNGDTTEYTINNIQLNKNDKVDALLQKLPGIIVSEDGSITVQNRPVSRVYIDGEEFFSYDPRIIVKNVRADAVQKVQLYEEQSSQTKASGVDDGKRIKVANIILKKDAKKSVFGNLSSSYGSRSLYNIGLFGGYFDHSRKIGLNTKFSSLNGDNIYNVPKIIGRPDKKNYGLTLNDVFKGSIKLYTDLNFNQNKNRTATTNLEKQFLTNDFRSNSATDEGESSFKLLGLNAKLSGNLGKNHEFDFQLKATAGHNIYHTDQFAESRRENGSVINTQRDTSETDSKNRSINPSLQLKFNIDKEKGRYLIFAINSSFANVNAVINRKNKAYFAASDRSLLLSSSSLTGNKNNSLFYYVTYGTKLGKYQNISLSYSANMEAKSESFLFEDKYAVLDQNPSYYYKANSKSNAISVSYFIKRDKFQSSVSSYLQVNDLKLKSLPAGDRLIDKSLLGANVNILTKYQISERSQFSFQYKFNVINPSIDQMTLFRPYVNPMLIYSGNIDLNSSKIHVFNGNYSYFNSLKNISFGSEVEHSILIDPIINNVFIDEAGRTRITNVNEFGASITNSKIYLSFSKGLLKNSLTLGPTLSYTGNSFPERLNNSLSINKSKNYSVGAIFVKQDKRTVDFTVRLNIGAGHINNDNKSSSYQNHLDFSTSSVLVDTKIYLPLGLKFSQRASFEKIGKDLSTGKTLLQKYANIEFSKELSKQNLLLSVRAYDIFGSYNNTLQRFSPNKFSQYNEYIVSQYIVFGLKWDFNKKL